MKLLPPAEGRLQGAPVQTDVVQDLSHIAGVCILGTSKQLLANLLDLLKLWLAVVYLVLVVLGNSDIKSYGQICMIYLEYVNIFCLTYLSKGENHHKHKNEFRCSNIYTQTIFSDCACMLNVSFMF